MAPIVSLKLRPDFSQVKTPKWNVKSTYMWTPQDRSRTAQSQLFTLARENREAFIRLMVHVLVGD